MSSPSVDIAFAMTGDVRRNARALRQLSALSRAGYRTEVIALPGHAAAAVLPERVSVRTLEIKGSGGPAFFWRVYRTFGRALRDTKARLYHASDLYVLAASAKAAGRTSLLTYDARELYAHVAAVSGRPAARQFWGLVERRHIGTAAHVWTVSQNIADHLVRTYRIAAPTVQFNAPELPAQGTGGLRTLAGIPSGTPLVLHLGQMRRGRGCETLIRALAGLPDARLVFLGYGPESERLRALTQDLNLGDRVHFVSPVPAAEVSTVIADADVGVTLLEDTCLNHRYALPNKLFDYLAAGLPVLASALPETERMVQTYDLGLTADPTEVAEVSSALRELLSNEACRTAWRRNARAAGETFDWRIASQSFISQIDGLLGGPAT